MNASDFDALLRGFWEASRRPESPVRQTTFDKIEVGQHFITGGGALRQKEAGNRVIHCIIGSIGDYEDGDEAIVPVDADVRHARCGCVFIYIHNRLWLVEPAPPYPDHEVYELVPVPEFEPPETPSGWLNELVHNHEDCCLAEEGV